MRSSTAELSEPRTHFGERIEPFNHVVDRPTLLPSGLDGMQSLLPTNFEPATSRLAGRWIAGKVSKNEFDKWVSEHEHLVEMKLAKTITQDGLRRLDYVRWNLDRIEDALYGANLDMMEEDVVRYEAFCKDITRFIEDLKQSNI